MIEVQQNILKNKQAQEPAKTYWHKLYGSDGVFRPKATCPFTYTVYVGDQKPVEVEAGDMAFAIAEDGHLLFAKPGPCVVERFNICTVLRGYKGLDIQVRQPNFHGVLPYINGCSTRQLIHADRPGDPTMQLLKMGPWTTEQEHHVHSTPRIVYIAQGKGHCIVGQAGGAKAFAIKAGDSLVLEEFCPHHFETKDDDLVALPLHIYSSVPTEKGHPMFLGTHIISN